MASGIDWTQVIVALITALTSIVTLYIAHGVRRDIKTPSGTSIGKQVESAHVTAISNNHRLTALTKNLEVSVPPAAEEHEAQIHDPINGPNV